MNKDEIILNSKKETAELLSGESKSMESSSDPLSGWILLVQIGGESELCPIELSQAVELSGLVRGKRVVCQTIRGLEIATIYSLIGNPGNHTKLGELTSNDSGQRFGRLIRLATAEDELAEQRLTKFKDNAIEKCNGWIQENHFPDLVVDTDITLDGTSVFFQFLGPISDPLNSRFPELVDLYEKESKIKEFVKAVEVGCGPDCGSDGSGCSTGGGCSSCGLKSACHSK